MNYLLRGGEFNNKGAEAMTLVALKHIADHDRDAHVYMIDYETPNNYLFNMDVSVLYFPVFLIDKILEKKTKEDYFLEFKDFIKYFIPGRTSAFGRKKKIERIISSIDIMIDISGFALSSKWPDEKSIDFCDWIRMMKKHNAKVYLMPQSFGPFNYKNPETKEYVLNTLPLCDVIYARERQGYNELRKLGLNNIELSPDSVLLEKDLNPSNLISNYEFFKENVVLKAGKKIGIIPNFRLLDQGNFDRKNLLEFYYSCIKSHSDCMFYLIAHAGEDLKLCKLIKQEFSDENRVVLIDHVLASFEYERIVSQFDFIIASRYHSIIHAYKEYTPAIILGWAEKYNEVAKLVNQDKYLIDLSEYQSALSIVDDMYNSSDEQKRVISTQLEKIQQKECYTFWEELINE